MKSAEPKSAAISTIQKKSNTPFFDTEHASEQESPFFAPQEASGTDTFFQPATRPVIQTKLTVGQPNDKYEQEADTVADKVVQRLAKSDESNRPSPIAHRPSSAPSVSEASTPIIQHKTEAPEEEKLDRKEENKEELPELQKSPVSAVGDDEGLQMKCAECKVEEESGHVQMKGNTEGDTSANSNIESQLNSSKGGGSPLPGETRTSMESAMGADFSNVRVHTGSNAVQMSQDLNAQAFTHGSDVYFNEGKYNPSGTEGGRLLAHELVHTVQQGGSINKKIIQKQDAGEQAESDTEIDTEAPEEEANEENSVPDDTPVQETHPTDCPQLVPPYPTEGQAPVSEGENSLYQDLLNIGGSGLLAGSLTNLIGMAARVIWEQLPIETQIGTINKALDLAISGSRFQRMLGAYLPGGSGFMLTVLTSVMVGFFTAIRNLPDRQKLWMFNRHMRIILGADSTFTLHFLKGILMGFFLDGIVGIIQMVIDIVCFIPKIVNFFSSLTDFIRNIPTELRALSEAMDGLMTQISNFLQNGIQEVYDMIKNPSGIVSFLQSISNSVNLAAESVGRRAAQSMVRFMNLPSAALGEIAGRISGQIIFEVVLTYFTAGGGAGLTAAKTALRAVGSLLMRIGKFIFKIIQYIGRLLRYVAEAMRAVVRFLTRIMRLVAEKVRLIIEAILDIFRAFRAYCRPGSIICILQARIAQINAARGDILIFRARIRRLSSVGNTIRPLRDVASELKVLLTPFNRVRTVTGGGRRGVGISTYIESLDGRFSIRITHNQVGANTVGGLGPRIHIFEGDVRGHGSHLLLPHGMTLADILAALN